MNRTVRLLTDDDLLAMLQLRDDGRTDAEIADALRVTKALVGDALKRIDRDLRKSEA